MVSFMHLLLLLLSSSFVFAGFNDSFRRVVADASTDAEVLERAIKKSLKESRYLTEASSTRSMFHENIFAFSSADSFAESIQYSVFFNGLLDYLDIVCLNSLKNHKIGKLSDSDREYVTTAIYLTALETKYFDRYQSSKVTIPDRNVVIYFKTLNTLSRAPSRKVFISFAKLATFCETETSLSLLYNFLMDYISTNSPVITEIKFKETNLCLSLYDKLITSHFTRYNDMSQLILLLKSVINGPVTKTAANFINASVNSQMISDLITDRNIMFKLANLLIETDSFSYFHGRMLLSKDRNESVRNLCLDIASWQLMHSDMNLIINSDTSVEKSVEIINRLSGEKHARFTGYSRINQNLVDRCVHVVHNRIMIMIEHLKIEYDNTILRAAFNAFLLIPVYIHPGLYGADYEILYDLFIENFEDLSVGEPMPVLSLCYPVALPYTIITPALLEKFHKVLSLGFSDIEQIVLNALCSSIKARFFNDVTVMKAVEISFHYTESKRLDFSSIAPIILETILATENYSLAKRLYAFFKGHNLLSKTISDFTESIIKRSYTAAVIEELS